MTDKIDTAAVAFNKAGACVQFMFNPEFLEKLDMNDTCFIVAHECLHVILNHGRRLKGLYPQIGNIAADITINEMLIDSFGFTPSPDLLKKMCLMDTVFKGDKRKGVEADREFEYYYQKIMEDAEIITITIANGVGPLDDHSMMPDDLPEEIKELIEKMSDGENKVLAENLKAGDGSSFEWVKATLKPKPKRKWEDVIRNWTIKKFREKRKTQWKVLDRRFTTIQRAMPKVVIPSVGPIDEKPTERIDMTFFMDVSGSCHGDSQVFFAAAKTIPSDKFDITPFAFDTDIIPIDISADTLPMGGGTSFHQLEEYCLTQRQYPSAVFVLTDGCGSDVNPKYPDRWHIFLTMDYKHNFPPTCNFYEFNQFSGNVKQ